MIGALVFLVLAGCALYRLMVGYPMDIGGLHIGQTTSFLVLVVSAAISLILFRSGQGRN
jgi:hypothetical protein